MFVLSVSAASKKRFQQKVYQKEGANILLTCPYISTDHNMKWFGPPRFTTYTFKDIVKNSLPRIGRVFIVGNHSSGEYNLEIRNFSLMDIGDYRCMTTNGRSSITADFRLDIYSKHLNALQCICIVCILYKMLQINKAASIC